MPADTVRVSAREIEDATRWAFIASGCSAGEATVAARVVQRAEIHLGCGIDAANIELRDHRFSDEPIRRQAGPVEVIDDEFGRGLLTLGPLATVLAATRRSAGAAVVLRNVLWHPVMAAILIEGLRASGSAGACVTAWPLPALAADRTTADERSECQLVGHVDAAVATRIRPGEVGPGLHLAGAEGPVPGPGIVIAAAAPRPQPHTPPTARLLAKGVEVDAAAWAQLYDRAENFLVDDS